MINSACRGSASHSKPSAVRRAIRLRIRISVTSLNPPPSRPRTFNSKNTFSRSSKKSRSSSAPR
eukprot:10372386-Heterocapsa_arctica.AAC.1